MNIIVPQGMFGANEYDTSLDKMLREIAVTASKNAAQEWAEKYGTCFENNTFMMHNFCWCESENCPWCILCNCEYQYLIDGKPVNHNKWVEFYKDITNGLTFDTPEYNQAANEANARRTEEITKKCELCTNGSIALTHGGTIGKCAPNFWYKPTDYKVWWYKYIGRSVETNKELTKVNLEEIYNNCLKSIKK